MKFIVQRQNDLKRRDRVFWIQLLKVNMQVKAKYNIRNTTTQK